MFEDESTHQDLDAEREKYKEVLDTLKIELEAWVIFDLLNLSAAYLVMQNRNLENGEPRCEFDTKQQCTNAPRTTLSRNPGGRAGTSSRPWFRRAIALDPGPVRRLFSPYQTLPCVQTLTVKVIQN